MNTADKRAFLKGLKSDDVNLFLLGEAVIQAAQRHPAIAKGLRRAILKDEGLAAKQQAGVRMVGSAAPRQCSAS